MKIKKSLLVIMLSMTLALASTTASYASGLEPNAVQTDDTVTPLADQMIDTLETYTIGKATYRLYTCTVLLSKQAEGMLSFSISSYKSGTTAAEKNTIKNASKAMSLTNVRASFIGGSAKTGSGSTSRTGTSGDYSVQSPSGSGILYYGSSTGTFYNDWTRNTSCSRALN